MARPKGFFGQQPTQAGLEEKFLTGPGQVLAQHVIDAMSSVLPFSELFGPSKDKDGKYSLRWADYARADWSIRELPAINIYEGSTEEKESSQAFVNGSLEIQVFWPPNLRRSDTARMQKILQAAVLNFFESDVAFNLLDPGVPEANTSPLRVPALNAIGRQMSWTPNFDAVVAEQIVPATLVDVRYRLDLRSWYRYLEEDDRTKEKPFERTLEPLTEVRGVYNGIQDGDPDDVQIEIDQDAEITP